MSKPLTPDEVRQIHILYAKHGSYAEVARQIGRSASAVRNCILKNKMTKAQKCAMEQAIGS